ncbi:U-box domain-containing protein 21-like [Euphorbia lathyris]|uniref:U-box domain-containing protein 21-like n=1 Tax=Euphorbia lathyris TaxID=212925 RepID=UPI003313EF56
MISTWKRRRAARRAAKELTHTEHENAAEIELAIPKDFRCPISLELMKDPVTVSTGITYDRENIDNWIERGNFTCPITNQKLNNLDPIPNHTIRKMIQNWCVQNTSYGIERIPTPRIPVNSVQVLEIQSKITASVQANDQIGCRNLITKMKALMKESERNKKCFVGNGTAGVLSEAFDRLSRSSFKSPVVEEILSTLTLMIPLDREARSYLGSSSSMDCLVRLLKDGDLSGRRNAVLVLKEIVCSDEKKLESLSRTEGASEAVFKLIKDPICPSATKASLVIIYEMVNEIQASNVRKFVEMGIVSVLTEILLDSEKNICEKALGVLDGICRWDEGRCKACENSLTIPVVVKKMHRVSELATEFAVSVLWKVCNNERNVVEAVEVGAFQKLLLQLQVGCGGTSKEKATELLKLFNPYRERLECFHSSDFKHLKTPF